MAERGLDKTRQSILSQTKKRPASTSKVEKSKTVKSKLKPKSASGPTKIHIDQFLAKEKQYKLLNVELEAKTTELVRQAEQLMKEQSKALSKPLSNVLLSDDEDEADFRASPPQQEPGVKVVTKKGVASTLQKICSGKQEEPHSKPASSEVSPLDDFAAVEDSAENFLAKTIQKMEERMNNTVTHEDVVDDVDDMPGAGEDVGPGITEAQVRVLKAKLRILQEELDQLSCEYYKKDDENTKLSIKIKTLEEDGARLRKTTSIQQTQIEKHRGLAEEFAKKCDGLQLQVSALHKEIENLNRTHKQAAAVHNTVEVRLNRALEVVERQKTELNKMKQINKDKLSEELQSKENLLAENKMLKKQKAELILGFKKQLTLIDILKRQKMHFETAKLLSFTEEEFMKALDWGKS